MSEEKCTTNLYTVPGLQKSQLFWKGKGDGFGKKGTDLISGRKREEKGEKGDRFIVRPGKVA
jgi:hypothetical protein